MPLALLVPRRLVMGLTLLLASACSLGAGRAPDATPTPVAVAGTLLDWDASSEQLTIRWRPAAGVTTVRVPTTSWGLLEPDVMSETGVRAVRWDPRSGTLELGTSGSAEVVEVRVTPRRS